MSEVITDYNKTIYKKDSSGKTRVLRVYTEGDSMFQESGVLGGKLIVHAKTCTSKNLGKENETTAEEQAVKEAKAKIQQKLDTEYVESIEALENVEIILPMLAKNYADVKIEWKTPVFVQPKLDGMRCLAICEGDDVKLISRKNREITTMGHIVDILKGKFTDRTILDGELYAHGKSFQDNMKLVKKYREGLSEAVKYCVYDTIQDTQYNTRYNSISFTVGSWSQPKVEVVETIGVTTDKEVEEFHKQFLSKGYEGTIVRHSLDGYKIKGRSSSLLKRKDFIDLAVEIIDIIPAEARPTWGTPVCELSNGNTFQCGTKLSHEDREKMLINKEEYIGKTAEVRFFEWTDDGLPRFPVFYGVRQDK